MKLKLRTLSLFIAVLALLLMPAAALAQPTVPMQFEGDVTIGDNLAPVGTIISAEVAGDEVVTNAPDGIDEEGYYRLDVSASEGDLVELYVDGDKGGEATYPDPMSAWHVVCDLAIEGEVPGTYTLTVDVSPTAGGDIEVDGTTPSSYPYTEDFTEDFSVDVEAVPASGYHFHYWSGDASGTSATTNLTMTRDKSVTAHFSTVAPPPPGVGGTAYPPDKLAILAPWIALGATLAAVLGWLVLRRRRAYRINLG